MGRDAWVTMGMLLYFMIRGARVDSDVAGNDTKGTRWGRTVLIYEVRLPVPPRAPVRSAASPVALESVEDGFLQVAKVAVCLLSGVGCRFSVSFVIQVCWCTFSYLYCHWCMSNLFCHCVCGFDTAWLVVSSQCLTLRDDYRSTKSLLAENHHDPQRIQQQQHYEFGHCVLQSLVGPYCHPVISTVIGKVMSRLIKELTGGNNHHSFQVTKTRSDV